MAKPDSLVIRERLYPDMHESLVDVLAKYPRHAGNQVVLAMSEACLGLWPITEADYHVSDKAEFQNVKFTLSKEKYPKLYALYKALPRGVKGQAIINLLNRHQEMRQVDPEKVSQALNAALSGGEAEPQEGVVSEITSVQVDSKGSTEAQGKQHVESREAIAHASATPPAESRPEPLSPTDLAEEMDDPLANLPPMEFT